MARKVEQNQRDISSNSARGVEWRARLEGLVPAWIETKRVAVVGCGSVGSFIAAELVRTGLRQMSLADPDTVDWPNLTRTVYGHRDIGRPKVEALAEHLNSIFPDVVIRSYRSPVQVLLKEFVEVFEGIDLVIAATDDPAANGALDRYCYWHGVPIVFVGLYRAAKGGEVIVTIPGRTPCFHCSTGGVRKVAEDAGLPKVARTQRNYETSRLVGEVALGSDIHFVCCAATKIAVSVLCNEDRTTPISTFMDRQLLEDANYLMLGMEPDYFLFPSTHGSAVGQYAFQSIWAKTSSVDECEVCGLPVNRQEPV